MSAKPEEALRIAMTHGNESMVDETIAYDEGSVSDRGSAEAAMT
jgi:hypothetical protein